MGYWEDSDIWDVGKIQIFGILGRNSPCEGGGDPGTADAGPLPHPRTSQCETRMLLLNPDQRAVPGGEEERQSEQHSKARPGFVGNSFPYFPA